ncbi:MAG: Lrp/AsnC family transcriptional regulator [Deltaproteobacteria bacterium]|nr:Lrp/AsnC family transcriptional regulator [Deltaproteobacteria bacterium]MBW2362374.1 Lrp/AsnC family transcriptional regulator [Deltaproteobacteria bacterium]
MIRAIQAGVPFVERPFEQLGAELGLGESEVLAGLHALSEQKILREISAVLEGTALGYDSALVAGVVPHDDVERIAKIVSAHPTVTHNYLRNHHYNLWFTLAVPREMSLEQTLDILARESGVPGFHPLRRTHTFKIGVNFDPETRKNASTVVAATAVQPVHVGEREARLFRALQVPLPLTRRPFDEQAQRAGVEADELLRFARRHLGGAIRRYVGTLRHRKLGVRANGMVVWRAPEEQVEALGQQLANAPEVSHCYARNAIENFPYTLYSMVHGPDRESCYEVANRLADATGIDDFAVLFSEAEFKKVRLRYFLPELDDWWHARTA